MFHLPPGGQILDDVFFFKLSQLLAMEMVCTLPYKPLSQRDLPTTSQTVMGSDTCTWQRS